MIPIFSNSLGECELKAIEAVFNSRWLGKGKQGDKFEREFANHLKVPQTLLFNSCTSAIYVGLRALGIGPGDEVIISTINFVGCANAVVDLGAKPVFGDVDPTTLNILPSEIGRLKTKRTKGVFLLHYGGHPCMMDEILSVCGDELIILEDSANSINSSYKGIMCGTIGDAGFWSFDAMKILVMTDGGALYLKNESAFRKAIEYRYLGLESKTTSGTDSMKENLSRWWEFQLAATSGRYISNDVFASIGLEQLKKLPEFISRRKQIWEYYQSEFSNISEIKCPPEPLPSTTSSYYLYWIQVQNVRDNLAKYLAENDVYTTFRYFPLHLVKYYKANDKHLPGSEYANETTLNLPLHQNLTDNDVQLIVDSIKNYFKK